MPADFGRQLDIYDCIDLASGICPDCEDIASCQAEGECLGRAEGLLTDAPTIPEWDAVA